MWNQKLKKVEEHHLVENPIFLVSNSMKTDIFIETN